MSEKEHILFSEPKIQQFRDADADGAIGMRAYLNYFQDTVTTWMHRLGWGNDVIHEEYGVAWVFLKYRMQVYAKTMYHEPLQIECWAEPAGHSVSIRHAVEIRMGQQLMARGRLESCLVDLENKRVARLDRIGYRPELALERENLVEPFTRIDQDTEGLCEAYPYIVRYTDLDNNRHMTNLRYIQLIMDAFTPEEFCGKMLSDLEIHYRNQCVYGDRLCVLRGEEEDGYRILARKEDGTPAICSKVRFADAVIL